MQEEFVRDGVEVAFGDGHFFLSFSSDNGCEKRGLKIYHEKMYGSSVGDLAGGWCLF